MKEKSRIKKDIFCQRKTKILVITTLNKFFLINDTTWNAGESYGRCITRYLTKIIWCGFS